MTYPAHVKALLTLGLPLVGSQLAQFLIGLTDTVMIGWYGVPDLAALVVASSIMIAVILVGAGFAFAVLPMVAAAAAAGDEVQVRRVTRMGLWASVIFSLLAIPVLVLWRSLFTVLGQGPEVAELARAYLGIVAFGLMPALIIMVLRSYLSALERTGMVLWVTLLSVVLNAALNWVLIFGHLGAPEMGVRGAALASAGSNLVAAVVLAVYAARCVPEHRIFTRLWRPDWPVLGQVFRLGWPIGLTMLAEVGLFSATSVMMGWIGTVPLAAHGIVLQFSVAAFMVHLGMSQAATIRAGRAYGAGDPAHLRRGAIVSMGLSLAVSSVSIVVMLIYARPLIGLFLEPHDPLRPAILGVGVTLVWLAALYQLADGAQVLGLALLRGVQDTRVPMIFAALSYWGVGAPVAYFLGFPAGLGAAGIWLGLVVGLSTVAVMLMHRFWFRTLPRIGAA